MAQEVNEMSNCNLSADISRIQLRRELTYNSIVVVQIDISYPECCVGCSRHARRVQDRINATCLALANAFFNYAVNRLYPQAVEQYLNAQENNFPFNPYEAYMQYEVTLNSNGLLSMYFDRYEYTGGAHGNTVRSSCTWSLFTGRSLTLSNLYNYNDDYRRTMINYILEQASANMAQNPNIYFDNYRDLIVRTFNPCSFFLTPQGVAIYYQQYDIAPYSTGIVVFVIPYENLGISVNLM